jgi:hypothetical protein
MRSETTGKIGKRAEESRNRRSVLATRRPPSTIDSPVGLLRFTVELLAR